MRALLACVCVLSVQVSSEARAEILPTNGIDLEYKISGAGEPLLLLHGFGNCIEGSWGPLIPELSRSHRVIAVNMRGHGGSTNPSNRFTHAQSAEDVRSLLDHLKIGKVRAIGFSSGGMTLLHLATRYPNRISKMVVVGATTQFGDQARQIMRAVASGDVPPPVRKEFERCATRGPAQADALIRQFGAFKDSYSDMNFQAADLAKIQSETLIVHGDRDDFFPVSIPVAMYGAIPKARLWIVPGGYHEPTAGASNPAFLEVVGKFLSE